MANVNQKRELTYPCMSCDKEVPISKQQLAVMLASSFVLFCDDCGAKLSERSLPQKKKSAIANA